MYMVDVAVMSQHAGSKKMYICLKGRAGLTG